MFNLLQDKKIVVTGASSGIGRTVAQIFASLGATLIITGRNELRLNETLASLDGIGHQCIIADLMKEQDADLLMKEAYNAIGPLDALVHCAGIQKTLPLKILKEPAFDEIFNLNVKSSQFLAKHFQKRGRFNTEGSSIIFISSVAATCGEPAISTYAASKAALLGLSKSLAMELSKVKIRVNCIAPGHVETEMSEEFSKQLTVEQYTNILSKHPLGLGKADDVANAAAFLASDMARWITGTTLYVDGGYSAH